MAAKTMEWRPGPTVCRCCLAEGCYKDISTEYFWMGKREVYSEMLSETFSVSIAYSTAGGPNSNSRLICEPCISRLRDASDFKRQVQECERTFMQHLDPGSTSTAGCELTVEPEDVKIETVKLEAHLSDVDVDDGPDFGDDDDDDLDDEPLTKFATKVPKKESVDLLDLIDNSKAAEKRKSTTKVKATPAKKTKKETVKPTSSKPKPEKKKKELRDPVRKNAELIIKYTTAYPFRVKVESLFCVYCGDLIDCPKQFRTHMHSEHGTFNFKMAFTNLPNKEYVKVDISELSCRICSEPIRGTVDALKHLSSHKKAINIDSEIGIMPYLLDKYNWKCVLCNKTHPSLLLLNKHTVSHFLNYICEVCGKSYAASAGLLQHVKSKHNNEFKVQCRRCRRFFSSMEAKSLHQRTEKHCMPNCCPQCPERFPNWELKHRHMREIHDTVCKSYHCSICDLSTTNRKYFYDHFKKQHSGEEFLCMQCGLKFSCKSQLNRHLKKHVAL
ncbi:zinc finger protein 26-like isoform X15 [Achroia grisella]|uniref:zinc finger protein 26-like isoform X15 n=1 Tax=Achroia grisella TaxID=688607 RepID=UPI0027D2D03C|nr:zinc finger protein 26-like isoform X15 [Achroia grisella]